MKASPVTVTSCDGCSNLALVAQNIALTLDSENYAKCVSLANILIKKSLMSSSPIIAIDGCKNSCCKKALMQQGMTIEYYYELSAFGLTKRDNTPDSLFENSIAMQGVYNGLIKEGVIN